MPIKLNCLIANTQYLQTAIEATQFFAGQQLENNGKVDVNTLYGIARDNGLEIDRESFAVVYNKAFSQFNDKDFSSSEDVESWGLYGYKELINEVVRKSIGEPTETKKEIGGLSPGNAVLQTVDSLFSSQFQNANTETKSIMRDLQDIMKKYVGSLYQSNKKSNNSIHDVLKSFFESKKQQFETIDGTINNLESLHREIKSAIEVNIQDLSSKEVNEQFTEEKKQELIDKYTEFVQPIMDGVYDIVLSKGEGNKLLNNLLSQSDLLINNENFLNKNGGISWSKVGGENGDPLLVEQKIYQLLKNGVKNEKGEIVEYDDITAKRISEYSGRLYKIKRDEVIAYRINNQSDKPITKSQKNSIISDFIKSLGEVKISRDAKGNDIISTDWKRLITTFREGEAGGDSSIQTVKSQLRDYLLNSENPLSEKLTKEDVDEILERFQNIAESKLKGKKRRRSAVEKLIKLSDMNQKVTNNGEFIGRAFDEETNTALLELLEINDLDKKAIDEVRELTELLKLINYNGFQPSTLVYTANKIQNQIQRITNRSIRNKSFLTRLFSVLGATIKAKVTTLLVNPVAVVENITTAQAQSLVLDARLVSLGFKPQAIQNFKTWMRMFFTGTFGVGEANMLSDTTIRNNIPSTDLYNLVQFGNAMMELYKDPKSKTAQADMAEQIGAGYASLINSISKVVLSGFDSAYVGANIYKNFQLSMFRQIEQYYGKKKALEIVGGVRAIQNNQQIQSEIDKKMLFVADQFENATGKKPTKLQLSNIKADLERQATTFVVMDALGKDINEAQAVELVSTAIHSAVTNAKIFNGKANMFIADWDIVNAKLYKFAEYARTLPNTLYTSAEKSNTKGNYNKGALKNMTADSIGSIHGLFANGIVRFLVLGKSAIPLLGLYDVASSQSYINDLLRKNPLLLSDRIQDIENSDKTARDNYDSAYSQRRSIIGRQIAGTIIALAFAYLRYGMGDDDENESKTNEIINNLMQTKEGRRIVRRFLPMALSGTVFVDNAMDKAMESDKDAYINLFKDYVNTTLTPDGSQSLIFDIMDAVKYAKKGNASESIKKLFIKNLFPASDINFNEKITKTWDALTDVNSSLKNDKITKEIYGAVNNGEALDWYINEFTRFGDYNTFARGFENRYSAEKKEEIIIDKNTESLIGIVGVGEKTIERLQENGIKNSDELKKLSVDEMQELEYDDNGKNKKVFSKSGAMKTYNQLHNYSLGKTDISKLGVSDDGINILESIGVSGIDEFNKENTISQLEDLKYETSRYVNSEGKKVKYQFVDEDNQKVNNDIKEKIDEIDNVINAINKTINDN